MPIQTSGAISLGNLQTEFGGVNPASITEYYRGGANVPATERNTAIPTSGQIKITDFYNSADFELRHIASINVRSYTAVAYRNVPVDISATAGRNRYIILTRGTTAGEVSLGIPEDSAKTRYPRINDSGTMILMDVFRDGLDDGAGVSMSYGAVGVNDTSVNVGWHCYVVKDQYGNITGYRNPDRTGEIHVYLVTSNGPITVNVAAAYVYRSPGDSYVFSSSAPNGFLIAQHVRNTALNSFATYDGVVGGIEHSLYDRYQPSSGSLTYIAAYGGYDAFLAAASFTYS